MLIGAHVSPAGGPAKAVARGARARRAGDPDLQPEPAGLEAARLLRRAGRRHSARRWPACDVDALLIHAVYLLNCASEDPDIRAKTLASLTQLAAGGRRARRARGRAAPRLGARPARSAPAIARAGEVIAEALAESDGCPLHLENTAGTGGTLGRSFAELAALIEAAGGDERLGLCLDSCHLLASGYDIRTRRGARRGARRVRGAGRPGRGSARCTSTTRRPPLGSNRDRHANIGAGRARRGRLRRLPLRAALRGTAVRAGDAGPEAQRPDARGDRALRERCASAGSQARG